MSNPTKATIINGVNMADLMDKSMDIYPSSKKLSANEEQVATGKRDIFCFLSSSKELNA